jgi:hypothetical protein
MTATFKEVRKLQGERVRMHFDDGREVVAQLLCVTRDMDGSKHLIYDKVEPGYTEEGALGKKGCVYADGRSLVSIDHADAKDFASGPRGRDHFTMRRQFEQQVTEALRRSA